MNTEQYLTWILEQDPKDYYTIEQADPDHLVLKTGRLSGAVSVYHLEADIIELRLTDENDENVFFLHFEYKDEEHAKKLFQEMIGVLKKQKFKRMLKVLLSCTSGMTTSFFAEKLSTAAETLSLDMTFAATAYDDLLYEGTGYDVILLAPQISYRAQTVRMSLPKAVVLNIPAALFASYDAGGTLTFLQEELKKLHKEKKKQEAATVIRDVRMNANIFVVALTTDNEETRYAYRLYCHGEPTITGEVIKERNTLKDIEDILDSAFVFACKDHTVDGVVISTPGVLRDPDGDQYRISYNELSDSFTQQYGLPVFFRHNTTTAAFGYYAQQTEYDRILYHSQPKGSLVGGQGIVYKGMPINGINAQAGEMLAVFRRFMRSRYKDPAHPTQAEIVDAVVDYLLVGIAECDPDVILLRSQSTPDAEEIRSRLAELTDRVPPIIHIDNVDEYTCIGAMLYGVFSLGELAVRKQLSQ